MYRHLLQNVESNLVDGKALDYRFYTQMRVEGICFRMQSEIQQMVKLQTIDFICKCGWKKNKAFAYRVPILNYNYLQCIMYLSSLYFLYANIHSPQICQRKIHQCQGLVCQCCDHVTCFLKEPRGMKLGFHDLHSEDLNILQLSDVRMLNM